MRTIEIAPKYAHLREFIEQLPSRIDHEGETVHDGRNLIKLFRAPDGTLLNVKRYHKPSIFNAMIYSLGMRQPKGRRAYDYPTPLLNAGIETPESVAYIEYRHCGLIGLSYFISVQCTYPNRFYEVIDFDENEYMPLAVEFAKFTAKMHKAGIMHCDYSPGNILWQRTDDGKYHFSVVDINRMYFGEVTLKMGCANFARLWARKKFFVTVAHTYAQERGFDPNECEQTLLDARRQFWHKYTKHHKVYFPLEL